MSEGDSIHHPQHGIGTVRSIRERSFSGPQGPRFAELLFPRDSLVMMVREDELANTIRKPIEKSEARKVLAHIGDWSESTSDSWKVRANAQQRKLDDGSPFALAEVYKTLRLRQQADALSGADRRQLNQSVGSLVEELAVALELSEDKVCRHMEKAALE
ncbi:MAG: CarD family transcriptional regulator [Lysobacterales bacterium]